MIKNLSLKFSLLTLIVIGAIFAQQANAADVQCTFTKDLALGDTGEDVRCLQKYLNGAGFKVATEGVGSPGNETSLYREKTVEAVKKWQEAKGVSPATGTFGPLSRLAYTKALADSLGVNSTPKPTTSATTPLPSSISVVKPPTPAAPVQSSQEKNVRAKLLAALNAIQDAKNDFEDAEDDDEDTGDADEMIEDAEEALFDALREFLKGSFSEAADYADSSRSDALKALKEIDYDDDNDDADEEDAEEALDDIKGELEDIEEDIEEADDDGDDVDEAEDLLDEAWDLFEEAEEAFDDEDWDDVIELVEEIEELIEDIEDEL
jgi:peptidoglycan hydrolase-like protein with peptidoglycan-binding domain